MEMDQFDFDKTTDELFMELIEKALIGQQSKFEFIRSYEMLKIARLYKNGVKKVVRLFKNLEKTLLKKYNAQVESGKQELELIMSIRQFAICVEYYKAEVKLVKDMISEFRAYVFGGHFMQTVLGGIRPDSDCVDFRKLPISLW